MKKFLASLLCAAALAPSVFAATPAATTSWVSNYVAVALLAYDQTSVPSNSVPGIVDADTKTMTFAYEDELYTVGFTAAFAAADTPALYVCESEDAEAMPTGTVFALDESTGLYENRTRAFPNAMALTVTDNIPTVSQVDGVWSIYSVGITNVAYAIVQSNSCYCYQFKLEERTITESEACAVGVTNGVSTAFAEPARRSFLEMLADLVCAPAYADVSSYSGRSTSFALTLKTTLGDGTTRSQSVSFSYHGPYAVWNPPDRYSVYVPSYWPTRSDWYVIDYWLADSESDGRILVTSYVLRGDDYAEIQVSIPRAKLFQLAGVGPSSCIPEYVEPSVVALNPCASGKHYYVRCECKDCGKTRAHDLMTLSDTSCDSCVNYDGPSEAPSSEMCGSTCSQGQNPSDLVHHRGWHDGDGVEYNMNACVCECYGKSDPYCVGWTLAHEYGAYVDNIGQGTLDDEGNVVAGTRKYQHHYYSHCGRDKGDGTACDAPVIFNEDHTFVSTTGEVPVPFIGDVSDPDNIKKLSYGEQSKEANKQFHYSVGMRCSLEGCDCEADEYGEHTFGSESCVCTACGLVVHEIGYDDTYDGGYICGDMSGDYKIVPGCARCNTYSPKGDPVHNRITNLSESLHLCIANDDEKTHTCVCGRVTGTHSYVEVLPANGNKHHYSCIYCGFEYWSETKPDDNPVDNYVISGYCGNWIMRDKSLFTGGLNYLADGTTAYFPIAHDPQVYSNYLCMVCVNTNPLEQAVCMMNDDKDIEHHGGWHNTENVSSNETTQTSGHCYCQCGMFAQDHVAKEDTIVSYRNDNGTCIAVGYCGHIGKNIQFDTECAAECTNVTVHALVATNSPAPVYYNDTFHLGAVVCDHENAPGCGFVTNKLANHVFTVSESAVPSYFDTTSHVYLAICTEDSERDVGCGFHTNVYENHTMSLALWKRTSEQCSAYDECLKGCGYTTTLLEPGDHIASGVDSNLWYQYNEAVANTHKIHDKCSRQCKDSHGNVSTCGGDFVSATQSCYVVDGKSKIVTVEDVDGCDYMTCGRCLVGNAKDVDHAWTPIINVSGEYPEIIKESSYHYCQHGTEDHVKSLHTLDPSNHVCTVCKYAPQWSYEYDKRADTIYCLYADCQDNEYEYRRYYITNGVYIAEEDRGEWSKVDDTPLAPATCHYYNDITRDCLCPTCGGECFGAPIYSDCYCKHIEAGELIPFCESIISGSYHLRYNGDKAQVVDFTEPVYEVESDAFDEAFINMPNLTHVYAGSITNVGARAFRHAFTNCPSLFYLDFSGLVTAGLDAFKGALTDTPVNDIEFKSLKDGDIDLFDRPSDYFTSLSVPYLDGGTIVVTNTPNLESIDMSHASYYAINNLPDLSALSKLRTLDFSEYDGYDEHGIPDFYVGGEGAYGRHAPSFANMVTNFMVVVPDALLDDWRNADGWKTISAHIVPVSNQVIGALTYYYVANGVKYEWDPNVTTVTNGFFSGIDGVTEVNASIVTAVGENAFSGMTDLSIVRLENATSVGDRAFESCSSLTSVIVSNATSIGNYAFYECSSLTNVDVSNATSIGENAFCRCTSIASVDAGNATSIGSSAFNGCTKLTSADVHNATSIGNSAFHGCTKLTSADVHNATSIGNSAFHGCTKLTSVDAGNATSIGNYAFNNCTSLTSVDVHNATSIEYSAFNNCTSLTSVDVHNATSIGYSAFRYCTSLTSVNVSKATSISPGTFQNCSSLTSVDVGNVTSVGEYAFDSCSKLTSVDAGKATSIGNHAFSYCTSLTSVDVGNATSIGSYAFDYCTSLTSVIASQFTKAEVAANWSNWELPDGCTVHCSDGDYPED